MILNVYSIRDIKSGYLTPTFEVNDAVALRNFKAACSRADSIFSFSPADFEIYRIAKFDSNTGEFFDIEREVIVNE